MIIQRIDLSEQIDLKKKLKQELDEIYRSAFEGPSPGKISLRPSSTHLTYRLRFS